MFEYVIPVFYSDPDIGDAIEQNRENYEDQFEFQHLDASDMLSSVGPEGAIFIIDAGFFKILPIKPGEGNIYFIIISRPGVPIPRSVLEGGSMVDILPPSSKADRILFALQRAGDVMRLRLETQDLRDRLEVHEAEFAQLLKIGISLSSERDIDVLLETILTRARELTGSDAGSLYLLENDDTGNPKLRFVLAQNDSREVNLNEFVMDATRESLAGYVALDAKTLNIDDSYDIPEDSPYRFDKKFDEETGYRTRSMLVLPMLTHRDEVIGVLQLINRKIDFDKKLEDEDDFGEEVIPFDQRTETLARSLGSQAAVSLENTRLYESIKNLFEGLVKASAKAIEARDPTTSGHSNRVASLTVSLAETVNKVEEGPFADTTFTRDQLMALKYAGLLHDFGKIGVREAVLVKEKKLYPWEMQAVVDRFKYVKILLELEYARMKLDMFPGETEELEKEFAQLDAELEETLARFDEYLEAVKKANEPAFLEGEVASILKEIGDATFPTEDGEEMPLLSEEEIKRLSIKKGSLSEEERKEIESHVEHSYGFLREIPWTTALAEVPEIAYLHHEKLDGNGYPRGLSADDLSVQARMMCIADIFDALTASDRPYKPAVPVEKALDILSDMAEKGHLDKDLLVLFVEQGVYESVL